VNKGETNIPGRGILRFSKDLMKFISVPGNKGKYQIANRLLGHI
jgi:hypothetical protein